MDIKLIEMMKALNLEDEIHYFCRHIIIYEMLTHKINYTL